MACPDECPTSYPDPTASYKKSHEVVDSLPEADIFRNVLVTVRNEGGAVYHIDEVGNSVCVSRSPLYEPQHNPEIGKYKNAVVFDFTNNRMYVYSPEGQFKIGVLA